MRIPYQTDPYAPTTEYVILGRVTAAPRFMQNGYAMLREQAFAQYPEADDVIHVQIDARQNIVLFFVLKTYGYELSGLAIKYSNKAAPGSEDEGQRHPR